ncbi:RNA-processing protein [Candidatus Woesearchaeota archaeon]|nr:RNA-processing protein [Candidatus Woesearchaeota archaeon]
MTKFQNSLRIPLERVGVLIGVNGSVKKQLEELTNTKINVNSKEGVINIIADDALAVFQAQQVVKAIGRGFNPDIAMLLLKQDYYLEIINVKDFAKTKNSEIRLKGRVIGEEGRVRRNIERLANVFISVYGKTISIIGSAEDVANARHAIDSLLRGARHGTVYKFLEMRARQARLREMLE